MRRYIAFIIVLLFLFTSCDHKDLCFLHPHKANVRIDVDWSQFEQETPTGMTVMVYSADGEQYLRHLTNTTTHALVDLESGFYTTIVFNQSDAEFGTLEFVGMDNFSTAEVHAVTTESRWYTRANEKEQVIMQPEWFATDNCTDVEVTPSMVETAVTEYMSSISKSNEKRESRTRSHFVIATHTPQNIIHTVTVKVHLKNIYNMRSARASLTGLASGYSFSNSRTTEGIVTQLLESWSITQDESDPTSGYITAKITTMGLPYGHTAQPKDNEFVISVLLVDNETVVDIPFSVGDKFEKVYDENGRYNLNLFVELWAEDPLPDVKPTDAEDGGFDAIVDEWGEEENVDIAM